jgi:hypothetical protein
VRDYGRVGPKFWIGDTGKKLRAAGKDAQIVGMYLMTGPHANMLGLYYLPKIYIAHETGLSFEGASEGLARCIEAQFCEYDDASEMVWVIEMAKYQIAESLSPNDNQCKGIQREYMALPENPFLSGFFDKYGVAYHMSVRRPEKAKKQRSSEDPSEGLRSQEQEQEQEQEDSGELDLQAQAAGTPPPVVAIPLNDGSEYGIYPSQVEEWSSTYPAVDVIAELRKMRAWSVANPKKRKTRRGVMAFANTWLSNTQDKPRKTDQPGGMASGEKYL